MEAFRDDRGHRGFVGETKIAERLGKRHASFRLNSHSMIEPRRINKTFAYQQLADRAVTWHHGLVATEIPFLCLQKKDELFARAVGSTRSALEPSLAKVGTPKRASVPDGSTVR